MRLIDADTFKKQIAGMTIANNYPVKKASALCDLIDAQPTAYDLDKVVEQIEKLKKAEQDRPDNCDETGFGDGEQIYDDGRSQGRFEAFGEAIKIVKGGGVDAF